MEVIAWTKYLYICAVSYMFFFHMSRYQVIAAFREFKNAVYTVVLRSIQPSTA